MIAFIAAAERGDDDEEVRHLLTLGECISRLLSMMQNRERFLVGVATEEIFASTYGSGNSWIARYVPAMSSYNGALEFDRFYRFCRLAAAFTFFVDHRRTGTDPEPMTFDIVCQASINFADGRDVPDLTEADCQSIGTIIVYLIGWILGRRIDCPQPTDDDLAALILGLQMELEEGVALETIRIIYQG